MLDLKNVSKTFHPGTVNARTALNDLTLHLDEGDFVTVIGGNGAGKSTLLNAIAGTFAVDRGSISIGGQDVTRLPEYKRAALIGRVFQDPMLGTAATMQIEENLALAARRGQTRGLKWGITKAEREKYRALTLLMASLQQPKLLLLDEHTAALDPKTAAKVLALSDQIVAENHLTTLMITHNMKDAIRHGNRLLMMSAGKVVLDISGEEKKKLTVEDLLHRFSLAADGEMLSDRAILS